MRAGLAPVVVEEERQTRDVVDSFPRPLRSRQPLTCSSTAAATAAEGSCCVSAVAGGCCCCCCGSGCCCSCDAPEAAAADKLTGATRLSSVSWEEAPTLDLCVRACVCVCARVFIWR
eukprot:1160252-Pelagomonas_calceolata.AAC.20